MVFEKSSFFTEYASKEKFYEISIHILIDIEDANVLSRKNFELPKDLVCI